jgi:hypothetical protein
MFEIWTAFEITRAWGFYEHVPTEPKKIVLIVIALAGAFEAAPD